MTEHEKLKEICDKIGYDILSEYKFKNQFFTKKMIVGINEIRDVIIDVGEIIFTQDFMDKFINYLFKDKPFPHNKRLKLHDEIMSNLNNSVDYLYNLLK